MRRLVPRSLGAAVEAWLGRLERGVDAAAQRRLAARWLRDAGALAAGSSEATTALRRVRSAIAGELGLDPTPPAAEAAAARAGEPRGTAPAREDDARALVLHLAALPRAVAAPDPGAPDPSAAAPTFPAGAPGPEASLALLADACRGATPRAARARTLAELAAARAPARWFPREGVFPGAANLLRAFVADAEGASADYAAEVCERLLRHVEVQRELALRPAGPVAPDAQRLEQVRFTLVLLEAAQRWRDLRFLNAALKRNDLHHRAWARRRTRSRYDLLAGLHGAAALARQEALVRELAP